MKDICHICSKEIDQSSSILLIDGSEIHQLCYKHCCNPVFEEDSILINLNTKKSALNEKIEEESGIFNSIGRLFDGVKREAFGELEQELRRINTTIYSLDQSRKKKSSEIKKTLTRIYDLWYERPPDWEERQNQIKSNYYHQCSICNSTRYLQVHHILPINKGGGHDLGNLILLCRDCHEEEHGNADFGGKYKANSGKSVFIGRLEKIKYAINNGEFIRFHYRKYEGEKSIRTIAPQGLRREGKSLCVYGYCQLRNDDRVFAIKRMTEVEIKHTSKTSSS